jgi:fumarylacetoacetase
MIDHTHEPAARSWVVSANRDAADFPIQNLPIAIFRRAGRAEAWRGGVAIGDQIVDLGAVLATDRLEGLFRDALRAASGDELNPLMAMGQPAWQSLRHGLFSLLSEGSGAHEWLPACLVPQADAEFGIPARIGDYTDFYTSIHHARTISKLFDPDGDVPANFRWVPTAYHGRVSSIGMSGQAFRRPNGQRVLPGHTTPDYGPCTRLDYELELGIFIGPGNVQGERIPIGQADEQVFGLCLLNDWSARDIQAWEMNPLGPFHAKNFATTLSPWIVTMEALAPFRKPWVRPEEDPQPLAYLDGSANRAQGSFDVQLEVLIETEQMRSAGMAPHKLSQTSFVHHYWSIAQMVAHHAAGGCNLKPGDLLGSGTISGPTLDQAGAMMELALAGRQPVALPTGETRSFLQDGDAISFRGWCQGEGSARIGFGSNTGRVLPAL